MARPIITRTLRAAGITVVGAYLLAVAFLMWSETRLVFLPAHEVLAEPSELALNVQRLEYAGADGLSRQALEIPAAGDVDGASDVWLIFLHGNGGTVTSSWQRYAQFRDLGLHVLAPEYTGYGDAPGTPSEAALGADALAAYHFLRGSRLVPAARIVIYGYSLGSCVAIDLASQVEAGALVVEGAIRSVVATAAERYPMFPVRLLMRNRFESDAKIGGVAMPVLFIHSPEDRQVPIADARALYAMARAPKRFLELPGGHLRAHLADEPAYLDGLASFLHESAGLSAPAPAIGPSRP